MGKSQDGLAPPEGSDVDLVYDTQQPVTSWLANLGHGPPGLRRKGVCLPGEEMRRAGYAGRQFR